jgi:hypothetical protein
MVTLATRPASRALAGAVRGRAPRCAVPTLVHSPEAINAA